MQGGDGGEDGSGQGGDSRQAGGQEAGEGGPGGEGAGGQEAGEGGPGGEAGGGRGGDSRQAGGSEAGDGGFGGDSAGAGGEQGDWPGGGSGGTGATGRVSQAESVFNESLEDFDEIMGAEQEAIARGGVGSAADEGFGGSGTPGGDGSVLGGGADGGGNATTGGSAGGGGGNDPASQRRPVLARAELPEEAPPPVEGCEDTDKVARQLCEAATKEEDPLLRAALWDEYNEYKKIVALQ